MTGRPRRAGGWVLLATAAALLVGLTACGGLPTPAAVRVVRPVTDEPRTDVELRRIPALPQQGQTPEEVVRGFLAAGADRTVAEQFLREPDSWHPERGGAIVFDGTPTVLAPPVRLGTTRLAVGVGLQDVLRVAADGSTRPVTEPSAPLRLVLDRPGPGEQWRIAALPDVLPLRTRDLAQSERRGTLAWLTPDRRALLSDPVLLPGGRDSLLSSAVTALLAGPSPRLAAVGVETALPAGTRAVRVVAGDREVLVDLDPTALLIPVGEVALARAQVAATLLSLPGVSSVRVLVQGQPLLPPGVRDGGVVTATDVADLAVGAGVQPRAWVAAAGRVTPLGQQAGPPTPPAGPGARAAPGLVALAVADDGSRTATLLRLPDGTVSPQVSPMPSGTPVQVAPPGDWTSVTWTREGALWLVRAGRPLVQQRPGQLPTEVAQPPDVPPLQTLLVAPDGVHAVGVTRSAHPRLVAVLVSSRGAELTDVHLVAPTLGDVSAVAFDTAGPFDVIAAGRIVDTAIPLLGGGGGLGTSGTTGEAGAVPRGAPPVWRVGVSPPDPTAGEDRDRLLLVSSPCGSRPVGSLAGRPGEPPLAGCPDGRVRRLGADGWSEVGVGRIPAWSSG